MFQLMQWIRLLRSRLIARSLMLLMVVLAATAVELPGAPPDDLGPDGFAGIVDSRQVSVEDTPEGERPARWIWFRVPGVDAEDRALSTAGLVYASDHGELAGEHGLWFKNTYHEASVRVPLIISLPEHRKGTLPPAAIDEL